MREPIRLVERDWFARDSVAVAPELLNKVLVVGERSGRIVEVEAYRGSDDPASHGRQRTPRSALMYGPAGHLYVYFSYGVHWCANIVCGAEGESRAVLLRAVHPVVGVDAMREARGSPRRAVDLTNGPGKLTVALGIDGADNGRDLVTDPRLALVDDGVAPPAEPATSTRIGISRGKEALWRWYLADDPYVSRR